jgi:hypothetical protein
VSELSTFVIETERSVDLPVFEVMIATQRRGRRRRSAVAAGAALAAVFAVALAVAGVGALGRSSGPVGSAPRLLVPDWTAEEVVGHPDAFVVRQLESRADPSTAVTVWKRCPEPRADHDCLGREAIAVVDGVGHHLVVLGAVTGSSQQPSLGDDGLLREVGDGVWYWAHLDPGPYLLSAAMTEPAHLTVLDRPFTRSFGVPSIECADRVGLCTLSQDARTLERLDLPQIPATRWATPTARGCGLWGLAGVGGNLRLIIQQRDGSFATADLPDDASSITLAEGGLSCEVAYYQGVAAAPVRDELVVSLDQGRTWHIRQVPPSQVAQLVEAQPRLRFLIPPQWRHLPPMAHPLDRPGALHPL